MTNEEITAALSMPGGLKLIEALKARPGWKANLANAASYLKSIGPNKKEHRQLSLIDSEDV